MSMFFQGNLFWALRNRVVRLVFVAALICSYTDRVAEADEIPLDPDGFTAYVAKQFNKLIPDDKIDVVGALRLRVNSPRGGWGMKLDTVHDFCRRDRPYCGLAITTFIREMTTAYETPLPPMRRSSLRVVVRPSMYVESMRQHAPGRTPLAVPLQGDLWMIGVLDLPTALQMLSQESLKPLHLSAEQALAIGKQNMIDWLRRQIRDAMKAPMDRMVIMNGDTYESSLFAFPELWTAEAQKMAGNLLIAVPSTDAFIFADGRKPDAAEFVAKAARFIMQTADRPFSATVFRWSPSGWILLPGTGDKHP